MARQTHLTIVAFHKAIATKHKEIKDFYRFNINEITGQFRNGIKTPALLLESHSADLESQTKMVSNFNNRKISFLLLDFAGKPNDFDKQDQVLDALENTALDICSYLVKENKDRTSPMYDLFDINTYKYEKVGPIFDNMYGWNILYELKAREPMIFDETKWNL